ncbi:unnamed protein product [Debaryomyces fabryi]|nr:unnamed protein product [Debaryomyces fabryi]
MYLPFPSFNNINNANTNNMNNTNSSNGNTNINVNISERPKIPTDSFSLTRPLVYPHSSGHMITSPAESPIQSIGHGMYIPPLGLPPQALQPKTHNGQQVFQEQLHSLQQQQQHYQQHIQQHIQHPQHPLHAPHPPRQHHLAEHPVNQRPFSSINGQPLQIMHDSKKKRGRPKKLILDPHTNQYIDSTHPNFKQLNKLVKSSSTVSSTPSIVSQNALASDADGGITKLYDQPTSMRTLEDEAVQQLLQKKDRRGRPRKFPIEETGLTIKGIRVNGTVKQRKKKDTEIYHSNGQRIAKRERGRPRKTLISPASPISDSGSSILSVTSVPYLPPPHLEGRDYRPQATYHSQIHPLPGDNTQLNGPSSTNNSNMYSMSRDPNLS